MIIEALTPPRLLVGLVWVVLFAGSLTVLAGTLLAALWVVDIAITRWLRMTRTMPLFLRFAWLDAAKKQALREDVERLQKKRDE